MNTRGFYGLILTAALALSGCASTLDMPFADNAAAAPDAGKAVFLMTVTTKNTYHTSYQPDMVVVNVERSAVKSDEDKLNFKIDKNGTNETGKPETGNTYLVRMQLDPGEYIIQGVTCFNNQFLIIATFFAPLHEKLAVTGPGVYYLGHVDATVRERVGGEFKAGPTIPLIDQGVAGASGGTFDITISDAWTTDEAQFDAKFSGLKGVTVQKAIMAPFDRAEAQKYWEDN